MKGALRLPAPTIQKKTWPCRVPESQQEWVERGPHISVVIPSFNQGEYLEEALRSILLQGYPHLELLVIDGGSSDNTLSVIEKYRACIDYVVSEPDRGQAHAINKGFARATGDLVAWCNADDYYYPFAFFALAQAYLADPTVDVYYGDKERVHADGRFHSPSPADVPTQEHMIPWPCIHSEVTFFQRRLFAVDGLRLNERRRHYMDYELFWHLILQNRRFLHVPGIRAAWRQHAAAKSSRQGDIATEEEFEIYHWLYGLPEVTPRAREKLLVAMQNSIRTDWARNRHALLRRHARQLAHLAGFHALPADIVVKTALSCVPFNLVPVVKMLNRLVKRK